MIRRRRRPLVGVLGLVVTGLMSTGLSAAEPVEGPAQAAVTVAAPLPGVLLIADAGAQVQWAPAEAGGTVRLQEGRVLIRVRRESVGFAGVEVTQGNRRFRLYDGTVVLEAGADGLDLGVLFRGRVFESGADGLIMDGAVAPTVSLGAGGRTVFHRDLGPLIRDDRSRVHRMVLGSLEWMTEAIGENPKILSSTDLASMVETARRLRLRIPEDQRLRIHEALVAAAQREAFAKRHRPFAWPELLGVPAPVEPWDRVFGW